MVWESLLNYETMKDFAEFLRALSPILWLIAVVAFFIYFRAQLKGLFHRLKQAKFPGGEVTLSETLTELDQSARKAEAEITAQPSSKSEIAIPQTRDTVDDAIKRI